MTETLFNTLYDFVNEMNPDHEMVYDYCESQDIKMTDEVTDVIDDLITNNN